MIKFVNDLYDASKCVRIVNPSQQYKYMKHGIYPIDIYPGYDGRIVYVFIKDETKEIYQKWIDHELD